MMYGNLCTEFYDLDKKFAPKDEIDFYTQFINKNDLILEPMCGSGRLLIPLLQNNFMVHGVDNSPAMLKSCRERAKQFGLEPTLFHESIESMKLDNKYDAILIPLGSFQLLYPRKLAFKSLNNFYEHLKNHGKLILDLFIPWDALYENNDEQFSEREVKTQDGAVIQIKSHDKANKYEQTICSDSIYTKIIDGKEVGKEEEQMYIAWYYRYEMELMLEKCGFKNISYKEEFFRDENHMIFIASK